MDSSLLSTKLRVPPLPHHAVERTRLTDHLERNVSRYKLILLSAPAGYGKSTLLSQWAKASQFPVAWLTLSREDNDFERFFRYLLASWGDVQPKVRDTSLGMLLSGMMPDRDAVLSAFINVAADAPDNPVLVLDDYHLIEEPSIHSALTFLLDHLPPTLHFMVSSRGEPPLPLARYRARNEMLQLQAEDLRFDNDEASTFLHQFAEQSLPDDQLAALNGQLEGWVAGLQLFALTSGRSGAPADEGGISGRHRFIADYLRADVLEQQPADIRDFLLRTSVLEHLSGALCDAVTTRTDGQDVLEQLERQSLFVVPLDDEREWFRYHALFADFLREELKRRQPDDVIQLHRRAARWYLDHDQPDPAFQHAMDGNDVNLTVEICDLYANAKLLAGEFRTVNYWLAAIPEEWYSIYPALGLIRAGFLAFSGDMNGCVRCIDEVEQRLQTRDPEEARWQQARVLTVRCFVACMHNDVTRAEELADRALRDLSEDDLGFRPGIYAALGDVYRQNGRWAEANANYLKVLDYTASPAVRVQSAHVFGALADLSLRQGSLRNAEQYWQDALSALGKRENWGRVPLPVIGWIFIRLAEILYEWNKLPEAWDYVVAGIQRAELGGDRRALIAGYLISGRLSLTQGDIESALEYLEKARPLVEQAQLHEWLTRFERFQLEVWLTQDRLRAAVDWADLMLRDDALQHRPEREIAEMALARVLIVKGDSVSIQQALVLLDRLLQSAESEGRTVLQIEGLTLNALAGWKRGDPVVALASLERALRLAEPEGYIRLFVDFGLSAARLLQEARARDVMPDYVEKLLAAFGPNVGVSSDAKPVLPEPLTGREQEILGLIAAGLTNREIGDRLSISSQTVKKHTGNIYGKLGVHSRTEGVAAARRLNLLS